MPGGKSGSCGERRDRCCTNQTIGGQRLRRRARGEMFMASRSRKPVNSAAMTARLLGTASVLAFAALSTAALAADVAPAVAPVEEVLITGSLIHGAEAV